MRDSENQGRAVAVASRSRLSALVLVTLVAVVLTGCGAARLSKPSGVHGIVVVPYPAGFNRPVGIESSPLPGGFGVSAGRMPLSDVILTVRAVGSAKPGTEVLADYDGIFMGESAAGQVRRVPGRSAPGLPPSSRARAMAVGCAENPPEYRVEVTVRVGHYTRLIVGPGPVKVVTTPPTSGPVFPPP